MAERSTQRSGVPWWAPLLALAALVAGTAAAAVATHQGPARAAHGGVLAAHTTAERARPAATKTISHSDRSLVAGGQALFPVHATALRRLGGRHAVAHAVRVVSVVGPRIFWVGPSASTRLLVHMQGRGARYAIRPGQRLDFTGVVTRNPPRAAAAWGLTFSEGRGLLRAQRMHLEVFGPRIRFR